MRPLPALLCLAALAAGSPFGHAQSLMGDSSLDGTTITMTTDIVDGPLGDGPEFVFYLLALDKELNATDLLNMSDWLPGGKSRSEFDLDVAAQGGGFVIFSWNRLNNIRRLFRGRIVDGVFDENM